jgi:peptidoglycan DL-endopeptidase CwlO
VTAAGLARPAIQPHKHIQDQGLQPKLRHFIVAVFCLPASLWIAAAAVAQPSDIEKKQAEAESVLAQIHRIDSELEHAIDAFNAAQMELDRIEARQRENERRLNIARSNLGAAQENLDARLVELYVQGDQDVLEVLLGATSLDELLDRLDTADRVSDQDTKIVAEVRKFRAEMKLREAQLARDHQRQEEVIAERAERRRSIEAQLAERQRLLSSIKSEIARLEAEERERQRRLEAQARARLAAEQAAEAEPAAPEAAPAAVSGSSSAPAVTSAPAARYGGVVGVAMQFLGTPYVWGGASPSGFDCSGFIMYVYAQVGVSLPHNAAMQYGYGSPVSQSELQPGDLVFFNGLGHAGIYIGGNQFIHSPHTGDVVKISSISGWYADTYVGARRL